MELQRTKKNIRDMLKLFKRTQKLYKRSRQPLLVEMVQVYIDYYEKKLSTWNQDNS